MPRHCRCVGRGGVAIRRDSGIRQCGRRDCWNPEEGLGFLQLYPSYEGTDAEGRPGGTCSHPSSTRSVSSSWMSWRGRWIRVSTLTARGTEELLRDPGAVWSLLRTAFLSFLSSSTSQSGFSVPCSGVLPLCPMARGFEALLLCLH